MKTLKLEITAQGVAVVYIDVPDRSVNVFTAEFVDDMSAMVEQVLGDPTIIGAVVTSAKSSFIAGADLKVLVDAYGQGITAVQASQRFARENALMRRLETGGKPFVAALNGLALGGGLELALACHHRVLVDHPKAVVGLPEVSVGLLPAGGGTQRLPRMIGIDKALPLLLEGTSLKPRQALELGVVDALVPAERLIATACEWVLAHPQVSKPWDGKGYGVPGGSGCLAPHAVKSFQYNTTLAKRDAGNYPARLAILSAVFEGTQLPFDTALAVEAKYFGTLLANPVARNLMRTMFINKGAADKLIRRPQGYDVCKVRKVGVLGAGMMGAGIAFVSAQAGIEVVLIDTDQAAAERGKAYSTRILDKAIERGTQTREGADAILRRIFPTHVFAELDGCDLVIEAVFETREVKAQVIPQAEAPLMPSAIFASNTSTLPISGLATYSQRPEKFIGMHFFSPVERMPLVEIIIGDQTSQQTIAHALDFVGLLRKTPILVNDSPGFYTSRIFSTYTDEGMAMLAEGVSPALIENAARLAGMATGPLAVTDEVSLDLQKRVIDQAHADDLPAQFLRSHARAVVEQMNAIGRLGRKSGGGFYVFPQGAKKHLWPGLAELFPIAHVQPDVQTVRNRLLYIMALETARCVEENVILEPADADLGAILGLGYPTWTGGTLSLIDTLGLAAFVAECDRLADLYGERFRPSSWLRERSEQGLTFHAQTAQ
ncbi:3-hydroxyacyl-CoA dehydrogenase NAD-binding domain-containing protein [Pseudomonas asiatica]|uniref:3-hydroxyacyl-CoA dehydrogenase NAD-binding domain-containing protein n=1 Tax=Pseudomonas asiatica TaxID=2219225 RepID=UPI002E7B9F07|nr:3-hydroxyacyl-CoA dehydrogenase NAD-binding domain-containing protein [Pseudomonas asiatica]MEE1916336.1 3-hydroxyacyl-CoA dehydrogenase NAD-binding domain-containing protein [Pseudomonas asiatica]